ncbi:hypothetical protein L1987_19915 [Smallanthus sonchifolius]|uniref:Uncharacterized protein n=1 Tax=Smallanthus sonchifolius TaxID=185202 RepID=A0ACB9IS08_9ASTR|nr:hypothetical protein L1987_19915 [Smallanthus sonchifolius]
MLEGYAADEDGDVEIKGLVNSRKIVQPIKEIIKVIINTRKSKGKERTLKPLPFGTISFLNNPISKNQITPLLFFFKGRLQSPPQDLKPFFYTYNFMY